MKSVVIVGGGVIGLYCALRLAKAGAHVTVLEAEAEARTVNSPTASAAAAGMLAPFDTESGAHQALALRSFDLWREAHAGTPWADGLRFDGAVYVSGDEADAAALQARIVASGRKAQPLSLNQARKRTGLNADLPHALYVPDEGCADTLRVLTGLAYDAHMHGVVVRYSQDAARVTPNAVHTHEGEVFEADIVVLAPGVWASDALRQAAPALNHVRPAKGNLVSVTSEKTLALNLHAPGFYVARRGQESVLGATMEFDRFDRRPDPEQAEKLLAAANTLLPDGLTQVKVWAGVRPMSPDGWPMVGPSGGVLIAAGHSRNGWGLAPITAEIVTAYVLNEPITPDWMAWSPKRFDS
jgi:glycine oxidase